LDASVPIGRVGFPGEICFGVVSLKEFVLSSRFSRFFFSVCRGSGRTFHAEAVGFFLNVFVMSRA
jgi:hypothetical protein